MEGTFADDRQILDSVLIAHECIDSSNRQRRLGIICKLDFEKAYDMVDWGFLQYMLERMGLGTSGEIGFMLASRLLIFLCS